MHFPPLRFAILAGLVLAVAACGGANAADDGDDAGAQGTAASVAASAIAVSTIASAQLATMADAGEVLLVDVREADEFAAGHIPGAINMPLSSFDPAAVPMEEGRETVLYCRSSRRSGEAADMLSNYLGGPVRHLEGGILAWEAQGLSTTRNAD